MTKKILSALLALCLLFCLGSAAAEGRKGGTVTITTEEYEALKNNQTRFDKLEEVLEYIQMYYWKDVDTDAMMDGAVQGMLAALDDPYTFYYDKQSWTDMQEDEEGEYYGIGIQMLGSYVDYTVTITRVFRDTPAERAGIRKGDVLVRVNDLDVNVETMSAAVDIMRGESGESVQVEVYRGGEYVTFDIVRSAIHTNNVDYCMLENNVGYVILYQFSTDAFFADFTAAVDALEAQGAASLILDLRDNPGGWVQDAVNVADRFLDSKMVVYSENRYGARDYEYTQAGADTIPLVVLINENSASSSEILSGCLQDYGRATIVGKNSYGKGIMQYVIPLSDNESGFQFTYCQYFTPNGHAVHGIGIKPDIAVEMPEDMAYANLEVGDMNDPQLTAAWEEALRLQDAPGQSAAQAR